MFRDSDELKAFVGESLDLDASGSVTITDQAKLREATVERLVRNAMFHPDGGIKEACRYLIYAAAEKLGISTGPLVTEKPCVQVDDEKKPVVAGGVMFRGRAVDKMLEGLPRRAWEAFTECPPEDLKNPGRVHLDSYGHLHLCQGLSMGNIWKTPIAELIKGYEAANDE